MENGLETTLIADKTSKFDGLKTLKWTQNITWKQLKLTNNELT